MTASKIRKILREENTGKIFLAEVPSSIRMEKNLLALRIGRKAEVPLVYLLFKYPFGRVKESLGKLGVDRKENVFIDAITQRLGAKVEQGRDNIMYLNSPTNLTNIGAGISLAAEKAGERGMMVVDSLEALMTYNSANEVKWFLDNVRGRLETLGMRAILFHESDKGDVGSEVLEHVDEVIVFEGDDAKRASIQPASEKTVKIEIPRYFIEALEWDEGDKAAVSVEGDGSLRLTKDKSP